MPGAIDEARRLCATEGAVMLDQRVTVPAGSAAIAVGGVVASLSLAVALIPMASGLYESGDARQAQQPDSELGGLARMFAVLLLIEVISLMGNYY